MFREALPVTLNNGGPLHQRASFHMAPLLLRHNAQARRRAPTPVSSGLDVLITGPRDLVPANSLAFPSPLVVVS